MWRESRRVESRSRVCGAGKDGIIDPGIHHGASAVKVRVIAPEVGTAASDTTALTSSHPFEGACEQESSARWTATRGMIR